MRNFDLVIPVYKEKKILNLLDYVFSNSKKINNIFICYDEVEDETIKIIKKSK